MKQSTLSLIISIAVLLLLGGVALGLLSEGDNEVKNKVDDLLSFESETEAVTEK